ncbi:hypothetical protein PIB30_049163 [Stylosanthes scabra]|uniref:Uncharacterized protein n=1 Tax=Stylosanthes scabra TaxID=79078 RepID=A0ABU6QH41_9FABA|nr:hypothetical protein [Stylosanthes scabra]
MTVAVADGAVEGGATHISVLRCPALTKLQNLQVPNGSELFWELHSWQGLAVLATSFIVDRDFLYHPPLRVSTLYSYL